MKKQKMVKENKKKLINEDKKNILSIKRFFYLVLKKISRFSFENRKYFYLSLSILFLTAIAGYLTYPLFSGAIEKVIEELGSIEMGNDFFSIFTYIFLHNISIAGMIILLHAFMFVPVFILGYNGFLIGAVLKHFFEIRGYDTFLMIVPHGIFEITGIVFATVLSIKLSIKLIEWLLRQNKTPYFKYLKENWSIFVLVIFFFFIAALIETALITTIS